MTKRRGGDVAASVRQRLLNFAHAHGEDFQAVLVRYAIERLLYRLSQSEFRDRFILKGAMLFSLWTERPHRPTWDLDLLGTGDSEKSGLLKVFRKILVLPVADDGLTFATEGLRAEDIRKGAEYRGVRVLVTTQLGTARIPLQIDIGFGDAVTPAAREQDFPVMLDHAAPRLRVYPRESVVSEKFQAMVTLELDNSRMKDFYDVWELANRFAFEEEPLRQAMAATFERRHTPLPAAVPPALTSDFYDRPIKRSQWKAFLRRSGHQDVALELMDVVQLLHAFLLPPAHALLEGALTTRDWAPGGPWRP